MLFYTMNIKPRICDTHYHFKLPTILRDTLKSKAKELGSSTSELMRFLLRNVYLLYQYPSNDKILQDMITSEREEFQMDRKYKESLEKIERKIVSEIN